MVENEVPRMERGDEMNRFYCVRYLVGMVIINRFSRIVGDEYLTLNLRLSETHPFHARPEISFHIFPGNITFIRVQRPFGCGGKNCRGIKLF